MKILANVGCVVLIFGCVKAIRDRMRGKEESVASTSFDWTFVWLLLIVAITGLLTEVFRFAPEPAGHAARHVELTGLEHATFTIYFVHLVLVFGLLVSAVFEVRPHFVPDRGSRLH